MKKLLIASAGALALSTAAYAQDANTGDTTTDALGREQPDEVTAPDEGWRVDESTDRGFTDQGDEVDVGQTTTTTGTTTGTMRDMPAGRAQTGADANQPMTDDATEYGQTSPSEDQDWESTEQAGQVQGQRQAGQQDDMNQIAQSNVRAPFSQQEVQSLRNLVQVTTQPVVQLGDHAVLSWNGKTASKMIGKDVVGSNDQKIGSIRDIVMSQDGQIQSVILGSGGFLGFNAREVEVGIDQFSMSEGKKMTPAAQASPRAQDATAANRMRKDKDRQLTLALTQEQLRQMPVYDRDSANGELFASDLIDGEVELSAAAAGDSAQTRTLRDLVIDNEGRARFAVLEDSQGQNVLVPYRQVQVAQGGEGLYVNMSEAELSNAIRFSYDLDEVMDETGRSDMMDQRESDRERGNVPNRQ